MTGQRHDRRLTPVVSCVLVLLLTAFTTLIVAEPASAGQLSLCGNTAPGSAPPPIQHVVVMDLENRSLGQIIGSPTAPYINNTLTARCGVATEAFGTTHTSAANYLALSAGQYPAAAPSGCGHVSTCTTTVPSLYSQMATAGLGWRNYVEGATANCQQTSVANTTKIGHNPGLFYGNTIDCQANVVPVASLTAPSAGNFWTELDANSLPGFSWVSPDLLHAGEEANPEQNQDEFLSQFLPQFVASESYQSGSTALIITYDEGSGSDESTGENCTDQTKDLAGAQESCHVPLWVVYPYNPGGNDATFLSAYSVTKGVDDLFGLAYLAHAGDAQTASLAGHFGLAARSQAPPSNDLFASMDPSVEHSGDSFEGRFNPTSRPTWATNLGYDGTHSIKVTSAASSSLNTGLTYKGGVIDTAAAGARYTASVWVHTTTPGQKISLLIGESGGAAGSSTSALSIQDTGWHQLTTTYVSKAAGDPLKFAVYASNLPTTASFNADLFSLSAS